MGLILPSDHGDADVWDVLIDTVFRTIDAHTHATGAGAKVNISQIGIDADVSFVDAGGGKHAITDLKAIDFFPSPASAMTGFAGAFFVSDGTGGLVLNELYFRTVLGTNIQFTNAGTLNVGAFAGTIGGDYTGVGALEIFDDASDAYWFNQQVGTGVRQFAKMRCADLSLFEFKAVAAGPPVPAQAVTLKSPTALAAGYALTMPGALPGSTLLQQVDSTGQMIWSNTVPNAVTLSGAVTASSTLVATGLITANGGVTAGANQNVTVSGTGDLKHGSRVKLISFAAFYLDTSPASLTNDSIQSNNLFACVADIGLDVGDRITRIDVYVRDNATGPTQITAAFKSLTMATGTAAVIASVLSAANGTDQTLSMTGLSQTVAAGVSLYIRCVQSAANASKYYGAQITYDRP
jgi:hypothetical protein